ncbi:hypothetical protein ABE527_10150 [Brucella sp. TWI432]
MADNFDKFYPDWVVGTLTLTSGSLNFAATDAQLLLAGIREGDTILTPGGLVLPIESINADGSGGVLAQNAPVSATFTTRIRFQSDNSRFTGMLAALVARMSGGNLQAFAGLLGAHDKMPIFTGPGTLGLVDKGDLGIQDPNGSLEKLAALTLSARQLLQTDDTGALKAIALLANKALVTDENKDLQQIDLGTLGRALLALTAGTNAQYVQGDGTLQEKSALPVSTPVQAALDGKANLSGADFTGGVTVRSSINTWDTLKIRCNNQSSAGDIEHVRNFDFVHMWTRYLGHVSSGDGQYLTFSYTPNGNWQRDVITILPNGNVRVSGTLSAASKSFETDHPLDPYNKDLVYASTESPSHGIEYWGLARLSGGTVVVDVDEHYGMSPGTFQAMTAEGVLFFQNQDSSKTVYRRWLNDGRFEICCEDPNCNDLIGWQVKGIRKDAVVFTLPNTNPITGKLIAEQEKPEA